MKEIAKCYLNFAFSFAKTKKNSFFACEKYDFIFYKMSNFNKYINNSPSDSCTNSFAT